MDRFAGQAAIVTGAASGLGAAVARRLASEGAKVTCLDVADGVDDTVAAIASSGGQAQAVRCDVRSEEAVTEAVAAAVAAHGPPRVLVNSAGVLRFAHTTESAVADWDLVIGVNLTGTYLTCRAVLPHLLDQGGAIVNIASTAGLRGQAYLAAYCASKGGVVQLTKALAEEYKARGVRVNAVAPAQMDTNMVAGITFPDEIDWALVNKHSTPMGSATPDEIAATVAFVASEEARFMTGAVVSVDGGVTV